MAERAWHRSLYWRIALGFASCLIGAVATQIAVALWLVARAEEALAAARPAEVGGQAAAAIAEAIEQDASADLDVVVREQREAYRRVVIAVMVDGRVISGGLGVPDEVVRMARAWLSRPTRTPAPLGGRGPFRRGGVTPDPDLFRWQAPLVRRGPPPFAAPIVVRGALVGVAVAQPEPLALLLVSSVGPTLVVSAIVIVGLAAAVASWWVFGPARRRLQQLQDVATRFGTGDSTVRASMSGGDEVAALAAAFDRMADDISARSTALEASDRARRQLLADVSHELMTPLTSIRGYAETLGMDHIAADPDARRRYASVIEREVQRLERLIGDVLEAARLEGGAVAFARETVDAEALVSRVASRAARAAEQGGVMVGTAIGPGAERIDVDPMRVEQALDNLVSNAIRHTPRGGHVDIALVPTAAGVRIDVRDTGEGIAPEHLPHVFDRFYRGDGSRAAERGGSGLGLAIVKAIVERHGGTVSVQSTEGKGTTMSMLVPGHPHAQGPAGE